MWAKTWAKMWANFCEINLSAGTLKHETKAK
jgi:hypothetical protein